MPNIRIFNTRMRRQQIPDFGRQLTMVMSSFNHCSNQSWFSTLWRRGSPLYAPYENASQPLPIPQPNQPMFRGSPVRLVHGVRPLYIGWCLNSARLKIFWYQVADQPSHCISCTIVLARLVDINLNQLRKYILRWLKVFWAPHAGSVARTPSRTASSPFSGQPHLAPEH